VLPVKILEVTVTLQEHSSSMSEKFRMAGAMPPVPVF
jgi:hypothetical protein